MFTVLPLPAGVEYVMYNRAGTFSRPLESWPFGREEVVKNLEWINAGTVRPQPQGIGRAYYNNVSLQCGLNI